MQLKMLSIAAAVAFALAGTAQAQSTRSDTSADRPAARAGQKVDRKAKKAEEDKIEADAKAAKAKCDAMQGQQKDVCQQEAKSHEKVQKAELAAKYNPSQRNKRKVDEAKAESEYDVAKAKCDMQGGKADNACKDQAKAEYDRAKADIKAKYAKAEGKRERGAATGSTRNAGSTK